MTATDISNWNEATIQINSNLDDIILHKPSSGAGADGNLYTLTQNGRTFEPDYYRNVNSTHYFRINMTDDSDTEVQTILSNKLIEAGAFQIGNYSEVSFTALNDAKTAGKKLQQNAHATEAQVTAQITAIDRAIKGLVATRIDKNALWDVIHEAESKAPFTYTWDSYANLQAALSTAKTAYQSGENQAEIDILKQSLNHALYELTFAGRVGKTNLGELVAVANERKTAQDIWNALEIKIPEYPPWAPHGFARLMGQLKLAQRVYGNEDKNYNQEEVNVAVSSLNVAINTMRPGNLPELEDLDKLLAALREAKSADRSNLTSTANSALTEAIEYAEMVVEYVGDGSGTHDMIENAIEKLTGQKQR
jgi:hypothetical protein